MMKVKNISLGIGNFPTVSQPRLQIEMVIPTDERIKEQVVDPLRLRIDPDPGVKVRRTALDDHDQRNSSLKAWAVLASRVSFEFGRPLDFLFFSVSLCLCGKPRALRGEEDSTHS
jgi:hypothetical protein